MMGIVMGGEDKDNNNDNHEILRMMRVIMTWMMMTNEGFDHTLCRHF